MPTSLSIDEHRTVIEQRAAVFLHAVRTTDLDAGVPTCPAWTLRDLTTHQGGVHRWATAHLRGEPTSDTSPFFRSPTGQADLAKWFAAGSDGLVEAIADAPADLEALRFLKDAPAPREFWARRQAHETTIHSVDAIAAALGRNPSAAEADVAPTLGADGLDELLSGFVPRGSSRLRSTTEFTIRVLARDMDRGWLISVSDEPPDVRPDDGASASELTVTGSGTGLYLALWNRGDEVEVDGDPKLLDLWRKKLRVRWSG